MHSSFKITYAAHTNACTFLLDAEGICRRIVLNPGLGRTQKGREAGAAANRCVGAQYVASLDASMPGILSEMPRVGIPMVFACVDERGRVSLIRTGIVRRFDNGHAEDPFSGEAPSISVETSAPTIEPARADGRRFQAPPRDPHADTHDDELDDTTVERVAYAPPSDRQPARTGVVVDLAAPTLRRPPKAVPPPRRSEPRSAFSAADSASGRHSSGR